VEDETLIRMMIAGMVEELGHQVVAEAGDIDQAIAIARLSEIDFAILDINVAQRQIDPVASILTDRGIPFIFASGYGRLGVPDAFLKSLVLQKPLSPSKSGRGNRRNFGSPPTTMNADRGLSDQWGTEIIAQARFLIRARVLTRMIADEHSMKASRFRDFPICCLFVTTWRSPA
jgi:CheY-like chemotaxis protein